MREFVREQYLKGLKVLQPTYRFLRWKLLWRQRKRIKEITGAPLPVERTYWHRRGINPFDRQGLYACQRLRNAYFIPYLDPSFTLDRTDSIFAIGSCFARGIETALAQRGFNVVSAARDFNRFELVEQKSTRLGFTNKYTTFSIAQELSWALDAAACFPEESIVALDDGTCIDPHITPTLKRVNRAGTLERRRVMMDVMQRIRTCRVVFLTLGLVEVWYDAHAGVYLNSTPVEEMQSQFPGRYKFFVKSYPENLANMERIYDLLTKYGHPDLQIVVTVSPVPLLATYSGQDVVLANTYSKGTLRAVAQDWAAMHANVKYFPSYEIIMNSDRGVAWTRDLRHVTGRIAAVAMDSFVSSFTREREASSIPNPHS